MSCGSSRTIYPHDVAVYGDYVCKNYDNRYFVFHKEGHVFESYLKDVYTIGRWEVHSDTLLLMNQFYCFVRSESDTVSIDPIDSLTILSEIERFQIQDKLIFPLDCPQLKYRQVFGLDDYFHKRIFTYENFVPFIK